MSKKITIAQLLPSIENGGVERGVFDLSKEILKYKDLKVIVISAGGAMLPQFARHKIKHITLPVNSKNPITIFLNIFRLKKLFHKYNVDICHARSRAPAWSGYFACKKTNCKFLTTFHGVYSFKGIFSKNSSLKKKYNQIMLKSNLIIAVSNFIKQHIITEYKISDKKIKVIHRGADLDYFSKDKVSKERIIKVIKKLKLSEDRNVILLPGRFTSWKGHNLLLDALEKIKNKDFVCLMVGKSNKSYMLQLEQKIKEKSLEDKIKIFDHISDMPALYLIASVILSTSTRPEAFGRIAIESGAMEKIIIATNLGGAKETVDNNNSGFLFDHQNPLQLAQKITEVLSLDAKTRSKIEKNARKRIENNFSNQKMLDEVIAIYRKY